MFGGASMGRTTERSKSHFSTECAVVKHCSFQIGSLILLSEWWNSNALNEDVFKAEDIPLVDVSIRPKFHITIYIYMCISEN